MVWSNTEIVCRVSSVLAELLAYVTLAAYGIIIVRTLNGKGPGAYLFMTTLAPAAIVVTKVPAVVGLLTKHVSPTTAVLFLVSVSISWTLQAIFLGQIHASVSTKVALSLVNILVMLYFVLSTSRFSRSDLYDKCKSGIFF